MNKAVDLRKLSTEELKKIKTKNMNKNPFEGMKIKSSSFLDNINERTQCRLCGKSRKYFCYTCYVPISGLEKDIPTLKLPCFIDIIKHPRETDGKSTAVHASIIAPNEVRIYTYPDIPDYEKESNIFLVFPSEEAIPLEEFLLPISSASHINNSDDSAKWKCSPPINRVVFIDCTWNQTKRIQSDERLKDLPRLQLNSNETLFWRYQRGKPKTYLATIEAIFYFIKAFHLKFINEKYEGEYDDLLFFFKYMYEKINSLYDTNYLLAYKETEDNSLY